MNLTIKSYDIVESMKPEVEPALLAFIPRTPPAELVLVMLISRERSGGSGVF